MASPNNTQITHSSVPNRTIAADVHSEKSLSCSERLVLPPDRLVRTCLIGVTFSSTPPPSPRRECPPSEPVKEGFKKQLEQRTLILKQTEAAEEAAQKLHDQGVHKSTHKDDSPLTPTGKGVSDEADTKRTDDSARDSKRRKTEGGMDKLALQGRQLNRDDAAQSRNLSSQM